MKYRTRFERKKVGLFCPRAERRTKSEFKDECDMNMIVARYRRTGVLPESARTSAARYGDFSQVPTYHEMFDRVLAAQDVFNALPAHVRKSFNNDPGEFLAASQTEEGQKLMVKLGLATARSEAPKEEPKASPSPTSKESVKSKAIQPEAKGKGDAHSD